MTSHRAVLGDFSSVVCLKAVIVGVEDTLGEDGASVVFTRAGRVRGQQLVASLGLTGKNIPVSELAVTPDAAARVARDCVASKKLFRTVSRS